jgi:ferredoxin
MALSIDPKKCPQSHRCPMLKVCPVGAISQYGYGLPVIDESLCIECGKCTTFCAMNAVHKKV